MPDKCFLIRCLAAAAAIILLQCSYQAAASERETELFNTGYEYLFSYKPDKAAEVFRTFLREFPDSSARDAAMFWLGKTLIGLRNYAEAEDIFRTIQREFPDSPFIGFIDIEVEEIRRARQAPPAKDSKPSQVPAALSREEETLASRVKEGESKLGQALIEREEAMHLLDEERKSVSALRQKIIELNARESLLGRQNAELEGQVRELARLEKELREAMEENRRLSENLKRASADRGTQAVAGKGEVPARKSDGADQEALKLRLAELEKLASDQGNELSRERDTRIRLSEQIAEEKRTSAALRDRELEYKALISKTDSELRAARDSAAAALMSGKEMDRVKAETARVNEQISHLQAENRSLTERIEDMDRQAEQRIRDMRILNSYLASLMFRKKADPAQNAVPKTKDEIAPGRDRRPADSVVRLANREYDLSQVVSDQTIASLTIHKLGLKEVVWRKGSPLEDFLDEELMILEAQKRGISADLKRIRELADKYRLDSAESDYLARFMTVAALLGALVIEGPGEQWIEVLSVDYKPGNAAVKTVVAADLQKAARAGKSFAAIQKQHPDSVRFERLQPRDFGVKYREKSQIMQKLNFTSGETVVMWSEKGYMLIKAVSGQPAFDPFEEIPAASKDRIRAFLKQWLSERRK